MRKNEDLKVVHASGPPETDPDDPVLVDFRNRSEPLSNAERQARWRSRQRDRRLTRDLTRFINRCADAGLVRVFGVDALTRLFALMDPVVTWGWGRRDRRSAAEKPAPRVPRALQVRGEPFGEVKGLTPLSPQHPPATPPPTHFEIQAPQDGPQSGPEGPRGAAGGPDPSVDPFEL